MTTTITTTLPSRPLSPQQLANVPRDAAQLRGQLREARAKFFDAWHAGLADATPAGAALTRAALDALALADDDPTLSQRAPSEIAAAGAVAIPGLNAYAPNSLPGTVVHLLAAEGALAKAVEALALAWTVVARSAGSADGKHGGPYRMWLEPAPATGHVEYLLDTGVEHTGWTALRWAVAAADDAQYEAARAAAESARAGGSLALRSMAAYAFPSEPAWARADAEEWLASGEKIPTCAFGVLASLAPDEDDLAKRFAARAAGHPWYPVGPVLLDAVAARFGARGAAIASACYQRGGDRSRHAYARALGAYDDPEVAEVLWRDVLDRKDIVAAYERLHPDAAARGLLRAAGGRGRVADGAADEVHRRLGAKPDRFDALDAQLDDEERASLAKHRALLGHGLPEALPEEYPEVLAEGAPSKGPGDIYAAASLPRIFARGRARVLPLAAMSRLLGILMAQGAKYHFVFRDLRAKCDAGSVLDFAWALFIRWLRNDGSGKGNPWPFYALGQLGGDEAARRLAPLIKAWPGENAQARAAAGVDVLALIGTDVALLHLQAIAERTKYKTLKKSSTAKVESIARARGLTPQDLADRLVPDLGLDPDGSRVLDLGGRTFRVGFDEQLKPHVRDAKGKRVAELPKATKSDDAEKAAEAAAAWKDLKANARAVASNELRRLEAAMCTRRRWSQDVFRTFMAEHPLVTHLARRLVWRAYAPDGAPAGLFRVDEERKLVDANDRPYAPPADAVIGIPHRLAMADEEARAWGGVFAEYELLQPFPQLDRTVYRPTEAEAKGTSIERVNGREVSLGKLSGLEARGWSLGAPQDAGVVSDMVRALPDGQHRASLDFDGGIYMGARQASPSRQKLGVVVLSRADYKRAEITWAAVDPVMFSELVTDLLWMIE